MSRYSFSGPYDRPAPEPHFIPGYTGHCPELADQIGINYSLATYFILKDRPDVASILADIHPPKSKYGSRKEHSSREGYKSRSVKGVGKDGYKREKKYVGDQKVYQEIDDHRCGSKEIYKSRDVNKSTSKKDRKRKQWNVGDSQKSCHQEVGGHASRQKQHHMEVDIAYDNNLKQDSYDCGSKSHRHLFLEGGMGFDDKQEMNGQMNDQSEGYKHSHSEGDKASGKKECKIKNMDKFIEKQKDLFCKMVSQVEKEKAKDTHRPCCNSLDFYKRTHCG